MTTDATTNETQATDDAGTQVPDSDATGGTDANAQLRAFNERLKDENKALRGIAMRNGLREIGLNHEEGLGVAVLETYQGDEYTPEAIAAFAQEKYKYSPEKAPPSPETVAADRVSNVNQNSSSVEPKPQPDAAREAQEKMKDPEAGRDDARASINAKSQQFLQQHYPGN